MAIKKTRWTKTEIGNAEELLLIACEIQDLIGSQVWMDKMKETPSEEEFREWEAKQIARIIGMHLKGTA